MTDPDFTSPAPFDNRDYLLPYEELLANARAADAIAPGVTEVWVWTPSTPDFILYATFANRVLAELYIQSIEVEGVELETRAAGHDIGESAIHRAKAEALEEAANSEMQRGGATLVVERLLASAAEYRGRASGSSADDAAPLNEADTTFEALVTTLTDIHNRGFRLYTDDGADKVASAIFSSRWFMAQVAFPEVSIDAAEPQTKDVDTQLLGHRAPFGEGEAGHAALVRVLNAVQFVRWSLEDNRGDIAASIIGSRWRTAVVVRAAARKTELSPVGNTLSSASL
jgi:hypothetical protein